MQKAIIHLIVLISFISFEKTNAQDFEWGNKISSDETVGTEYTQVDQDQNVYSTGFFTGTLTYDIDGVDSNIVTEYGITNYVQKIDAWGNREWLYTIGGNNEVRIGEITVDSEDNLYVAGYFKGSWDFDPSEIDNIVWSPKSSIFIQKLNSDGELIWIKTIDQVESYPGMLYNYLADIELDSENNIVVIGWLNGTMDMDPGEDSLFLSTNEQTCFVQKMNEDGELLWVSKIGDTTFIAPHELEIDSEDNIYIRAESSYPVNFSTNSGVDSIPGFSHLILKMDDNGNNEWARSWKRSNIEPKFFRIDQSDNIYINGLYKKSTDFDPGEGVHEIGLQFDTLFPSHRMIFLLKLNDQGEFQWVIDYGGNGIIPSHYNFLYGLNIDSHGNIYNFLSSDGHVNFDPANDTVNLESINLNSKNYINIINSNGYYISTIIYPGLDRIGSAMTIDHMDQIYTSGRINGGIDLDFSDSEFVLYNTNQTSIFFHKMGDIGDLDLVENSPNITSQIYPNPSSQNINILLKEGGSGKLNIIDLQGRLLRFIEINPSQKAYLLDISTLTSGAYFIELIRNGKKIESQKFLKK